MVAKLTSKNQLTLPKAVVSDFHGYEYFEVSQEHGRILLTPVRLNRAAAVRAKLAELGVPKVMSPMPWTGRERLSDTGAARPPAVVRARLEGA